MHTWLQEMSYLLSYNILRQEANSVCQVGELCFWDINNMVRTLFLFTEDFTFKPWSWHIQKYSDDPAIVANIRNWAGIWEQGPDNPSVTRQWVHNCDVVSFSKWTLTEQEAGKAAHALWFTLNPCKDVWAGGEGVERRTRNKRTEPATPHITTLQVRSGCAVEQPQPDGTLAEMLAETLTGRRTCSLTWIGGKQQGLCAGRLAPRQGRVRHLVWEVAPK